MESIIELFSSDVIWSAIFASCITIFGVYLTNKYHERRQKSEQNFTLKKEVFLDVAKSFADVLGIIPKLTNLEFTQKDIEMKMADHEGIVAKSCLVAKESSVAAILNYSAETNEVFIKLIKEREVVLAHQKTIEIYQSTINSAENEQDRIISRMKELNHQGHNNQSTFDNLNKKYDVQESIVEHNTRNLEKQESTFRSSYLLFIKECIDDHGKLLLSLPPMAIALRGELENNRDSKVFTEALNNNVQRMKAVLDSLFESDKA
ncbi:hypothetical protein BSPLISOX_2249 [uncultured Gammaproteobacteria bacterium]|nr:hypothetical protein BSPLISOX_2249 [uncultured Gammaproteobacteria bacterium]